MIAIISDLHMQHTSRDGVRYRSDGGIREAGIRRNIDDKDFSRLFSIIHEKAGMVGATDIHLVFAGDIFELLRTPLWLFGDVRPTETSVGPDEESNPLRETVHRILDALEEERGVFWKALRDFAERKTYVANGEEMVMRDVDIRVSFIPGNHDRLVNAWPSTRKRVRKLLSISPENDLPFSHFLELPLGGGSRVLIRHGQEYDSFNFSLPNERGEALSAGEVAYVSPCLGDYLTTDLATRMAVAFRVYNASALRGEKGAVLRRLYLSLSEFDDVRPQRLLLPYLSQQLESADSETLGRLKPVLRDLIREAERSVFVGEELRRRNTMYRFVLPALHEAIRNLSLESIKGLLLGLVRFVEGDDEGPSRFARLERGIGEGIDLIVGGHTHKSECVSLLTKGNGENVYYLNTGSWRTTISQITGDIFRRQRACSMVFCYGHTERTGGRHQFESWAELMLGEETGPYDRPVDRITTAGRAVLRFTRCRVNRIDEGNCRSGAHLFLNLGVDDQERGFTRSGVMSGDAYDLTEISPVILDPNMDGELWAHGLEKDRSGFIPDKDDPLGWAVAFLKRDESEGFAEGEGAITIRRRSGEAVTTDITIGYTVEKN